MRRFVPLAALAALVLSLVAATIASAGGRPYTVALSWHNEVTAAGVPDQGEPGVEGTAWVTVNPGTGEVCYAVDVSAVSNIVAGHIHRAPSTTNGPIVVPFVVEADGSFAGCATGVARSLALELIRDPDAFYVNIHSAVVPAGAARGQLGD